MRLFKCLVAGALAAVVVVALWIAATFFLAVHSQANAGNGGTAVIVIMDYQFYLPVLGGFALGFVWMLRRTAIGARRIW